MYSPWSHLLTKHWIQFILKEMSKIFSVKFKLILMEFIILFFKLFMIAQEFILVMCYTVDYYLIIFNLALYPSYLLK